MEGDEAAAESAGGVRRCASGGQEVLSAGGGLLGAIVRLLRLRSRHVCNWTRLDLTSSRNDISLLRGQDYFSPNLSSTGRHERQLCMFCAQLRFVSVLSVNTSLLGLIIEGLLLAA